MLFTVSATSAHGSGSGSADGSAEGEVARLQSLRDHHTADPGLLGVWLDYDIDALEQRVRWLNDLADKLEAEGA